MGAVGSLPWGGSPGHGRQGSPADGALPCLARSPGSSCWVRVRVCTMSGPAAGSTCLPVLSATDHCSAWRSLISDVPLATPALCHLHYCGLPPPSASAVACYLPTSALLLADAQGLPAGGGGGGAEAGGAGPRGRPRHLNRQGPQLPPGSCKCLASPPNCCTGPVCMGPEHGPCLHRVCGPGRAGASGSRLGVMLAGP